MYSKELCITPICLLKEAIYQANGSQCIPALQTVLSSSVHVVLAASAHSVGSCHLPLLKHHLLRL